MQILLSQISLAHPELAGVGIAKLQILLSQISHAHPELTGVGIATLQILLSQISLAHPELAGVGTAKLQNPIPDDGQYGPKHVVVSITVIKYTSVIKLCLTTYLFPRSLLKLI